MMDKFNLEKIPLFENLNEKEFTLVKNFLVDKKYIPRDKIFRKGATRDKIIIITKGQAALKSNLDNKETIALFKTGNSLGEMCLLQKHSKHNYDLEANSHVETMELSIYNWHSIVKKYTEISNKIYQNIAVIFNKRLKHSNNKLVSLFATANIVGQKENLDEMAVDILKIILKIIPSEKALLATFSSDTQKIRVHQSIGYKKIKPHSSYDIKSDQLLQKLITNSQTIILAKHNVKPEYKKLPYMSNSLIASPIMTTQKIIGFIMLSNKNNGHNFSDNNKILLEAIANQIAPAIQQINLKKLEEAQKDIKNIYIEPF